ncbi:hypothetical protein SAMN04515669_0649 [Jiangella sp. DSM 45060]|nr:hypothetical protein SAMN04515669_0649 [Jiangella sp. DSM 45060]
MTAPRSPRPLTKPGCLVTAALLVRMLGRYRHEPGHPP